MKTSVAIEITLLVAAMFGVMAYASAGLIPALFTAGFFLAIGRIIYLVEHNK